MGEVVMESFFGILGLLSLIAASIIGSLAAIGADVI
jgi:hypothetical protein